MEGHNEVVLLTFDRIASLKTVSIGVNLQQNKLYIYVYIYEEYFFIVLIADGTS